MQDSSQKTAISLEKKYHFQIYDRFPVTFVEGKGARVIDDTGKEYIDALGGIAVNSVGHCHPNVVDAIKKQSEKIIHISNFYYNIPQSKLAKLLVEVSGLDKVFFCNSGAEAVEGAIKLARRFAYEQHKLGDIIGMENCFHGRTIATITLGKEKYQRGFGPLPSGFKTIALNDTAALENIIESPVIAIILETIQGESGIYPANVNFLQKIRKICDEKGIVLILDEVQCGLGRAGKLFAYQYYNIIPDILILAKALGGGVPIGAVLAKNEIAEVFHYGDHGTTFGGNPLACAAALATVQTIIGEELPDKAEKKGQYFRRKLEEINKNNIHIADIRGMGLMIGIELTLNTRSIVLKMFEKGVLANNIGENIIRFVPPLVITYGDLDKIIEILKESIEEIEKNNNS